MSQIFLSYNNFFLLLKKFSWRDESSEFVFLVCEKRKKNPNKAKLCATESRVNGLLGEEVWSSFVDSIVSVFEVACARPEVISKFSDILAPAAAPLLVSLLISRSNHGSRLLYVKLLTDLLEVVLGLVKKKILFQN